MSVPVTGYGGVQVRRDLYPTLMKVGTRGMQYVVMVMELVTMEIEIGRQASFSTLYHGIVPGSTLWPRLCYFGPKWYLDKVDSII